MFTLAHNWEIPVTKSENGVWALAMCWKWAILSIFHGVHRSIMWSWRPKNSRRNKCYRWLVIPVAQRSESLANWTQAPRAPSPTEIEDFPQLRPRKPRPASD